MKRGNKNSKNQRFQAFASACTLPSAATGWGGRAHARLSSTATGWGFSAALRNDGGEGAHALAVGSYGLRFLRCATK
ncbi:MAG: hypothetical protein LBH84_01720 [Prevotellaceae bacterium]|nr:hypothetical protein [Prevotellaceae bacterium]